MGVTWEGKREQKALLKDWTRGSGIRGLGRLTHCKLARSLTLLSDRDVADAVGKDIGISPRWLASHVRMTASLLAL